MSTTTALRQRPVLRVDAAQSTPAHEAPQLRVVEGISPKRAPVAFLLIGLLVVILTIAAPMVLQTRMAERAFEIREYQLQLNEIQAQAWTAQTQLRNLESAVSLEQKARSLGMVPAQVSGTITLSTGTVDGGVVSR